MLADPIDRSVKIGARSVTAVAHGQDWAVMSTFHATFAWVVVAANGLVGAWALIAHRWPRWRSPALWWSILVAEVALAVQVLAGVWLLAVEHRHARDFHAFYGFGAILAIAIIYSYRPQLKHVKYLLYGLGSLFLMGMALRAIQVV